MSQDKERAPAPRGFLGPYRFPKKQTLRTQVPPSAPGGMDMEALAEFVLELLGVLFDPSDVFLSVDGENKTDRCKRICRAIARVVILCVVMASAVIVILKIAKNL